MIGEQEVQHVKIFVFTDVVDGYPPEEWESLWATRVGKRRFKIDNIPFYARDLSCGDIVEAQCENGMYMLSRVIKRSTHSTIRVIISEISDTTRVRDHLTRLGCCVEGVGIDGMIAIDVPRPKLKSVLQFLEQEHELGKLDFEHGPLR